MSTYVDSSVLLRLVLGEQDPLRSWDDIVPVSSELARVECLRAIDRYRVMSALRDDTVAERRTAVIDLLNRFRLVEPSHAVLERASEPFPVSVATLDAIHLATALILREESAVTTFATHDARLGLAAQALGFEVVGV